MSQRPVEQQIANLISAADAVAQHNEQFSLGATIAKMMRQTIARHEQAQELQSEGLSATEAEQTVEAMNDTFEDAYTQARTDEGDLLGIGVMGSLGEIGLALGPTERTWFSFSSTGELDGQRLDIRVVNGPAFVDFLSRAAALPGHPALRLKEIASEIGMNTVNRIRYSVRQGTDAQEVHEALTYANGIAVGLGALGDRTAAPAALRKIAQRAAAGHLAEYVTAERCGLFAKPGAGYDISNIHRDCGSGDYIVQRWQPALDVIRVAKQMPEQQHFAEELAERAAERLLYAKADLAHVIATKPQYYGGWDDYGTEFAAAYAVIEYELEAIAPGVMAQAITPALNLSND